MSFFTLSGCHLELAFPFIDSNHLIKSLSDVQVLGRKPNLPSVDKGEPAFFAPAGRLGAKNGDAHRGLLFTTCSSTGWYHGLYAREPASSSGRSLHTEVTATKKLMESSQQSYQSDTFFTPWPSLA